MKRILILFPLLLTTGFSPSKLAQFGNVDLPSGGGGGGSAPAYVQEANAGGSATAVTTSAITTTSGNLVVVWAVCGDTVDPSTPTITDSKGNTWTQIGTSQTSTTYGGSYHVNASMWYAKNITGGASHTFTVTGSANSFPSIMVMEISGASTSSPLDTTSSGSDASSPFTLDITTGVANTIIVSGLFPNTANSAITFADSGATVRSSRPNGSTDWAGAASTKTGATATTYSSSWTATAATDSLIRNASFKP